MFRKITIKAKVVFLSIFGVAVSLLLVGMALYSLSAVGGKLKQITEEDIPMTSAVANITTHQLEQAVLFERAARYAESMGESGSARKHYKESKQHFLKLAHKVDKEILGAEKMVHHIIEIEAGHPEIVKEFQHVEKILKKIEKEHKDFDRHVEEAFALFEAGRFVEAEHLAEKIEQEEDQLTKELEGLLKELQNFTAHAATEAQKMEHDALMLLLVVAGGAALFTIIFSALLIKSIIRPLHNIQEAMVRISDGDLETEVPRSKNEDETTAMAEALEVFRAQALETRRLEAEALKAQARAEEQKRMVMLELADGFDNQVGGAIGSLASASTELQSSAEGMRMIADETSQHSQTVAASTEEASANVNTVASAMEEMSATSSEIAAQITSAKSKSNDTAGNAEKANETVSNLNALVENIGEVVIAIQDIAEQTNLLALNATIEAARAGDAGKGFAVVADEVKKLATETGKKTEEINSRINEIQDATRASVDAMGRIIGNITEIDESVTGISAAVEEQNATTAEIVRSISEASEGVQNVTQTMSQVQQGASETGTSADAVLQASGEVSKLSENLSGAVESFLGKIRSDNAGNDTGNDTGAEDQDRQDEQPVAAE